MALRLTFAALAAVLQIVNGHFTFVRLKADGEWKEPLQYIRNKTSPYDEWKYVDSNFLYRYYNWPTYYVDRPESVRCGRGNMDHANATEVLKVRAGDTIEIAQHRGDPSEWTEDDFKNCPDNRGTCYHKEGWNMDFNHPGPLVVHLSKVPEGQDIHTYDGTGDWVKIHSRGLANTKDRPLNWELYRADPPHLEFKIPPQTPAGKYLMRMDVVWSGLTNQYIKIGEPGSLAQMYPSCAHLDIQSDSRAPFPAGVKIPDIFAPEAPGMVTSSEMANRLQLDANYTYPGGPLWDGEKFIEDKPV
ncbi:uncharacterized protein EI97DRAFT_429896 [Westerdykella ornata]|uniref:lytic cellulose monooxygenase (C4-dehydrogenating) n=1 Tax=Westerdykella ornata TaxID=318751 RepID=A0A6A6JWE8_WESOR|nr:uncharacterized protein EI97DRAFT_429896 [Westerdykella ornata]KAF2280138.1 hypothetical protein EI97DRAFT_429896 [Westerdykella ornata]